MRESKTLLFLIFFFVASKLVGQEIKMFQNLITSPSGSDVLINDGIATSGDTIYFWAKTQNTGLELWKTKGDSASTRRVTDNPIGSKSERYNPSYKVYIETLGDTLITLTNPGLKLRFTYPDNTSNELDFYITGTYSYPVKFRGGLLLSGSYPNSTRGFYFYKNSTLTWISDVNNFSNSIAIDTTIFFYGGNYETSGIWKTNGKINGTTLIIPRNEFYFGEFANIDNQYIIFSKSLNRSCTIWKLDLTNYSTEMIMDLGSTGSYEDFFGMKYYSDGNGNFYFTHQNNLYKSNGTFSGTIKLNPSNIFVRQVFGVEHGQVLSTGWINGVFGIMSFENSSFQMLKNLTYRYQNFSNNGKLSNGKVIFEGQDDLGHELWVSDFTASGTKILKDLNLGPTSSQFSPIRCFGDFCLYGSNDPASGFELFRTNGTEIGTYLIKDLDPSDNGILEYDPFLDSNGLYEHGDLRHVINVYNDSIYIDPIEFFYTSANPSLKAVSSEVRNPDFKPIAPSGQDKQILGVVDNTLFYGLKPSSANGSNWTFYKKDLNENITELKANSSIGLLKKKIIETSTNIYYESTSGLVNYYKSNDSIAVLNQGGRESSIVFNGYIFSTKGYGPWNRDLVRYNLLNKQLNLLYSGTHVSGLITLNNTLYVNLYGNPQLYKSDDGVNFARVHNDLVVWKNSIKYDSSVVVGGHLRQYGNSYASRYSKGLFKYNSTHGLQLIKSLTKAWNYFNFNNVLYFLGNDGIKGDELWRTDGSTAGTFLVKDINLGIDGSSPEMFFVLGNNLYFLADDGIHGKEIWTTDGTAVGTKLISSITDGVSDPNIYDIKIYKGIAYFLASNCNNGIEVWQFNPNFCESIANGAWSDSSIWNCGRVPGLSDEVKINSPHKVFLDSNPNIGIKSIHIEKGSTIELNPNFLSRPR